MTGNTLFSRSTLVTMIVTGLLLLAGGLLMQRSEVYAQGTTFDCEHPNINVPVHECEALVDLYNSTDGENWDQTHNRIFMKNVDSRYGIYLAGGHVEKIELANNDLNGTIPTSINNLSKLKVLDLSNNDITGTIPNFSNTILTDLHLNNNQLSGLFPVSLGNTTTLKKIMLQNNNLIGLLPTTLKQIRGGGISSFFVNNNHLDADEQGNALIPDTLTQRYNSINNNKKNISNQQPVITNDPNNNNPDTPESTICPAGQQPQNTETGIVCIPCDTGNYCPGDNQIIACPANSTSATGSTNPIQCGCNPGFAYPVVTPPAQVDRENVSCIECQQGSYCPGGNIPAMSCPNYGTTENAGSTSINECNVTCYDTVLNPTIATVGDTMSVTCNALGATHFKLLQVNPDNSINENIFAVSGWSTTQQVTLNTIPGAITFDCEALINGQTKAVCPVATGTVIPVCPVGQTWDGAACSVSDSNITIGGNNGSNQGGNTNGMVCDPGTYTNNSTDSCETCPANSYCPGTDNEGVATAYSCNGGTSLPGSEVLEECQAQCQAPSITPTSITVGESYTVTCTAPGATAFNIMTKSSLNPSMRIVAQPNVTAIDGQTSFTFATSEASNMLGEKEFTCQPIVGSNIQDEYCGPIAEVLINSPAENGTCTDHTQNGDETGVDCGGSCPFACDALVCEGTVISTGTYSTDYQSEENNINKRGYRTSVDPLNNIGPATLEVGDDVKIRCVHWNLDTMDVLVTKNGQQVTNPVFLDTWSTNMSYLFVYNINEAGQYTFECHSDQQEQDLCMVRTVATGIPGCTNPAAENYNEQATRDDDSCIIIGCTDPNALNYNPNATSETVDNCNYPVSGCTDPNALNYNDQVIFDDGSCEYTTIPGCIDPTAHNYNTDATADNDSCETCTDGVLNGDETAIDCGGTLCGACTENDKPTVLLDKEVSLIPSPYNRGSHQQYDPDTQQTVYYRLLAYLQPVAEVRENSTRPYANITAQINDISSLGPDTDVSLGANIFQSCSIHQIPTGVWKKTNGITRGVGESILVQGNTLQEAMTTELGGQQVGLSNAASMIIACDLKSYIPSNLENDFCNNISCAASDDYYCQPVGNVLYNQSACLSQDIDTTTPETSIPTTYVAKQIQTPSGTRSNNTTINTETHNSVIYRLRAWALPQNENRPNSSVVLDINDTLSSLGESPYNYCKVKSTNNGIRKRNGGILQNGDILPLNTSTSTAIQVTLSPSNSNAGLPLDNAAELQIECWLDSAVTATSFPHNYCNIATCTDTNNYNCGEYTTISNQACHNFVTPDASTEGNDGPPDPRITKNFNDGPIFHPDPASLDSDMQCIQLAGYAGTLDVQAGDWVHYGLTWAEHNDTNSVSNPFFSTITDTFRTEDSMTAPAANANNFFDVCEFVRVPYDYSTSTFQITIDGQSYQIGDELPLNTITDFSFDNELRYLNSNKKLEFKCRVKEGAIGKLCNTASITDTTGVYSDTSTNGNCIEIAAPPIVIQKEQSTSSNGPWTQDDISVDRGDTIYYKMSADATSIEPGHITTVRLTDDELKPHKYSSCQIIQGSIDNQDDFNNYPNLDIAHPVCLSSNCQNKPRTAKGMNYMKLKLTSQQPSAEIIVRCDIAATPTQGIVDRCDSKPQDSCSEPDANGHIACTSHSCHYPLCNNLECLSDNCDNSNQVCSTITMTPNDTTSNGLTITKKQKNHDADAAMTTYTTSTITAHAGDNISYDVSIERNGVGDAPYLTITDTPSIDGMSCSLTPLTQWSDGNRDFNKTWALTNISQSHSFKVYCQLPENLTAGTQVCNQVSVACDTSACTQEQVSNEVCLTITEPNTTDDNNDDGTDDGDTSGDYSISKKQVHVAATQAQNPYTPGTPLAAPIHHLFDDGATSATSSLGTAKDLSAGEFTTTDVPAGQTFSFSAWIKSKTAVWGEGDAFNLTVKDDTGIEWGVNGVHGTKKIRAYNRRGDDGVSMLGGDRPVNSIQNWNHVVFVVQGNGVTMYLNGSKRLGKQFSPNQRFLVDNPTMTIKGNAFIDDMRLYNTALTELQVKDLYHAVVPFVAQDPAALTTPPDNINYNYTDQNQAFTYQDKTENLDRVGYQITAQGPIGQEVTITDTIDMELFQACYDEYGSAISSPYSTDITLDENGTAQVYLWCKPKDPAQSTVAGKVCNQATLNAGTNSTTSNEVCTNISPAVFVTKFINSASTLKPDHIDNPYQFTLDGKTYYILHANTDGGMWLSYNNEIGVDATNQEDIAVIYTIKASAKKSAVSVGESIALQDMIPAEWGTCIPLPQPAQNTRNNGYMMLPGNITPGQTKTRDMTFNTVDMAGWINTPATSFACTVPKNTDGQNVCNQVTCEGNGICPEPLDIILDEMEACIDLNFGYVAPPPLPTTTSFSKTIETHATTSYDEQGNVAIAPGDRVTFNLKVNRPNPGNTPTQSYNKFKIFLTDYISDEVYERCEFIDPVYASQSKASQVKTDPSGKLILEPKEYSINGGGETGMIGIRLKGQNIKNSIMGDQIYYDTRSERRPAFNHMSAMVHSGALGNWKDRNMYLPEYKYSQPQDYMQGMGGDMVTSVALVVSQDYLTHRAAMIKKAIDDDQFQSIITHNDSTAIPIGPLPGVVNRFGFWLQRSDRRDQVNKHPEISYKCKIREDIEVSGQQVCNLAGQEIGPNGSLTADPKTTRGDTSISHSTLCAEHPNYSRNFLGSEQHVCLETYANDRCEDAYHDYLKGTLADVQTCLDGLATLSSDTAKGIGSQACFTVTNSGTSLTGNVPDDILITKQQATISFPYSLFVKDPHKSRTENYDNAQDFVDKLIRTGNSTTNGGNKDRAYTIKKLANKAQWKTDDIEVQSGDIILYKINVDSNKENRGYDWKYTQQLQYGAHTSNFHDFIIDMRDTGINTQQFETCINLSIKQLNTSAYSRGADNNYNPLTTLANNLMVQESLTVTSHQHSAARNETIYLACIPKQSLNEGEKICNEFQARCSDSKTHNVDTKKDCDNQTDDILNSPDAADFERYTSNEVCAYVGEIPTTCDNGADNAPDCTQCPTGQEMVDGQCVAITSCNNGALNPPECNQCPFGTIYDSNSDSCVSTTCNDNQCQSSDCVTCPDECSSTDMCTATCDNGAINSPHCNICPADMLYINDECINLTCNDNIHNGDETDVDCGGSCPTCTCTNGTSNYPACDECPGDLIFVNDQCTISNSCTDGIKNGNETGIDCGGNCPDCTNNCTNGAINPDACDQCPAGQVMSNDNQCITAPPSCDDGIKNGNEEGIDCGGDCPNTCIITTGNNAPVIDDDFGLSANCSGYAAIDLSTKITDPENDPLTIVITQQPGNGIATISGTQLNISNGQQCSNGTILYQVSDGQGNVVNGTGYLYTPCDACGEYCANGATNPPSCDQCPAGQVFLHGQCLTPVNHCMNGATNFPDCNQCASGYSFSNNQCIPTCQLTNSCGGSNTGDICNQATITMLDGTTLLGISNDPTTSTINDPTCIDIIDPDPSCTDGIKNGDEKGVDCGGSCPPCTLSGCTDTNAHNYNSGATVDDGSCLTCDDGLSNGDETGIDCGGSCNNACVISGCTDTNAHNYDNTATADDGSCLTCSDGSKNGDEEGIDCGGSCATACPIQCEAISSSNGWQLVTNGVLDPAQTTISCSTENNQTADIEINCGNGTKLTANGNDASISCLYGNSGIYTASCTIDGQAVQSSCQYQVHVTNPTIDPVGICGDGKPDKWESCDLGTGQINNPLSLLSYNNRLFKDIATTAINTGIAAQYSCLNCQIVPTTKEPICTNGAVNAPLCNICPANKILVGGQCITPVCSNGAVNPTDCDQCPAGQTMINDICTNTNATPTADNVTYTINCDGNATINLASHINDADGDPLTISIIQQPSNGIATINGNKIQISNGIMCSNTSLIYKVMDDKGAYTLGQAQHIGLCDACGAPSCPQGGTRPNCNSSCPAGFVQANNGQCVLPVCSNGALNPPYCNACPLGTTYDPVSGTCTTISCPQGGIRPACNTGCPSGSVIQPDGTCTPPICPNGASNYPACDSCPSGYNYDPVTDSCLPPYKCDPNNLNQGCIPYQAGSCNYINTSLSTMQSEYAPLWLDIGDKESYTFANSCSPQSAGAMLPDSAQCHFVITHGDGQGNEKILAQRTENCFDNQWIDTSGKPYPLTQPFERELSIGITNYVGRFLLEPLAPQRGILSQPNSPYGEFKIALKQMSFDYCGNNGEVLLSVTDECCMANTVITKPYVVQKSTLSANTQNIAGTIDVRDIQAMDGTSIFDAYQLRFYEYVTNPESYNGGSALQQVLTQLATKYTTLATQTASLGNINTIQKVPGKEIYLAPGDLTISSLSLPPDQAFTVFVNGDLTIEGDIKTNGLFITPNGKIKISTAGSCDYGQVLYGMFIAGNGYETLVTPQTSPVNDNLHKPRCQGGNLRVIGGLIGKNVADLVGISTNDVLTTIHRRNSLDHWFYLPTEGKQELIYSNGALSIELSTSLLTNPPKILNEIMGQLNITKQ